MSATNRGSERQAFDLYETPLYVIRSFLRNYKFKKENPKILEPSAGNGNFCRILKEKGYNDITAVEIQEDKKDNLKLYVKNVITTSFLNFNSKEQYDIIIGNPPYSIAREFIIKAFDISNDKDIEIIFLLRLSFLESKERIPFWKNYPISELHILAERPSFINGSTDAASYAFFVWNGRLFGNQLINIIDTSVVDKMDDKQIGLDKWF